MNPMGLPSDRSSEWFVPRWGPPKFRIFIGLLFLPYTGMVLSFCTMGAMIAETVHWDRVLAAWGVYFFGLGIAAHALDAIGSRGGVKPWGAYFSRAQLWAMAGISLVLAYGIALYYIIRVAPLLWTIALLEGFFVFAYNLEWFQGRFHTDSWFAFSWGMLPVLAGYVLQTNGISTAALVVALAAGLFSLVEITASRPYKEIHRRMRGDPNSVSPADTEDMVRYEKILKCISSGVILLGAGMMLYRFSI